VEELIEVLEEVNPGILPELHWADYRDFFLYSLGLIAV
jgi:hypothetical protein